jgi:UDP-N-acetylmuramoyl-L-alanyl-D-glutamate--2,6-diaminopimelate ligase
MRLSEMLGLMGLPYERLGADPDVLGIAADSRRVRSGYIFAAVAGAVADGREFVDDAIGHGAAAVLTERKLPGIRSQVLVDDVRLAYALLSSILSGNPSCSLLVAGITGTNGKTTTAYMMRNVLRGCGVESGLLGTVAYEIGGRTISATRTTPDAAAVQDFLRQMLRAGCAAAVMEVSSHALVQKRVAGVDFDVAVFTNLTPEHLDYHKTMDGYYAAKAELFRSLKSDGVAVVNGDDEWGRRLLDEGFGCRKVLYGIGEGYDIGACDLQVDIDGSSFGLLTDEGRFEARIRLPGRHNVSNALACIAGCRALGVGYEDALSVLAEMETVCGRLERVDVSDEFAVFVDYAHTGDALRHALETVREITTGRMIVVFGCGGDRDREKRPVMGRVACELADVVVVTSDNPRGEEPGAIIEEIMRGVDASLAVVEAIEDRADAICYAVGLARPGDSVIVAGKGHETYQEVKGCQNHFDDHEVVMGCMR